MTRKLSTRRSEVERIDVYQEVTNQIITMLKAGTRPWSPSWGSGAASLPLRHEGTAYRGVNVLLLWSASMSRGYTNPYWMTYRQASELGGQVRKGERGNLVVHAGTFTPKGEAEQEREGEEGEERARSYLKKICRVQCRADRRLGHEPISRSGRRSEKSRSARPRA